MAKTFKRSGHARGPDILEMGLQAFNRLSTKKVIR
jgi:hypothetical protein